MPKGRRPRLGSAQIHGGTKLALGSQCIETCQGCYHFRYPKEKRSGRGLLGPSQYTNHKCIPHFGTTDVWGWTLLCWPAGRGAGPHFAGRAAASLASTH